MVQADISQLSRECNTWRDALRAYREEFNQCNHQLQELAARPLSKDDLTEVEHYHNQFHIQLINIHDLKHAVKNHERKVEFETSQNGGQVHEDTLADHEGLFDQFQRLEHTLTEVREEFSYFLTQAH